MILRESRKPSAIIFTAITQPPSTVHPGYTPFVVPDGGPDFKFPIRWTHLP